MIDEHRELIARLFPDLELRTLEPIGTGWTFDTYDVNGEWIVQLPRSRYAEDRLRAQIALLPELVLEVSALIPMPELTSLDPPAMVYRKLAGVPADRAPEGFWPERLGRFLYDLHLVPPEIVGMRTRAASAVREDARAECGRLREVVVPRLAPEDAVRAEGMLASYLDDDDLWTFAACLTHGDLASEHVLVDAGGDLVGILDWEDVAVGDPALDFAHWLHAMPAQGERALAAYGGAPDATFRRRARLLFALSPWHQVAYGVETGDDSFVKAGLEEVRARLP
ncbi:MAG: phosphotransferase [Planctomycetaceae bacterium]